MPTCHDAPSAAAAPRNAASSPPGGFETILLVEDEAAVRVLVKSILERAGYRVIAAPDPVEALRESELFEGEVHLLLTDVVMPKMNGRKLADVLSSLRPSIRVMYMSGYAEDAITHQGALDPGTVFLQKPLSTETLLQRIRDVLEAAVAGAS